MTRHYKGQTVQTNEIVLDNVTIKSTKYTINTIESLVYMYIKHNHQHFVPNLAAQQCDV